MKSKTASKVDPLDRIQSRFKIPLRPEFLARVYLFDRVYLDSRKGVRTNLQMPPKDLSLLQKIAKKLNVSVDAVVNAMLVETLLKGKVNETTRS